MDLSSSSKVALTITFLVTSLLVASSNGAPIEVTFGGCLPNKTNCSVCYHTLKESLLKRDDNVRRLSETFFPPKDSQPEFVEVRYHFGEEKTNNPEVWFWTHDSPYLFFPIEIFQYMSLFFGKPANLFRKDVDLILDEECLGADHEIMILLTQRLKAFVQWASFDPRMEDNYYARSQDDKLNNGDDTITEQIAMFIIAFFVTGFFATFAIIIILLIMYYSTKRWDKKLSNLATSESRDRHTQSNIFAVSLTMMVINIYAIALDITAIVTNVPCKDESDIHEPKILCKLPYIVFGVDVLGGFVWIICSFSAMISSCFKADRNHDEEEMPNNTLTESNCSKQKQYFLLAVSTLGPTATVVIHLPYIFIAYLNDAEHATSMFIYYIIVVFVIFAALNFAYITCQREIVAIKHEIEEDGTVIFRKCCSKKERQICCIKATYSIVVFPVFLLLILFLIGMITTAIFTTQITRSFDDTSNRLLGFYQTVIVLIGAYLLYNKYFKTKPSIESAVKKRDHAIPYKGEKDKGTWIKFSKKEKMEKFYDHFVDIIAKEACSNGLSTDAGGDGSPDAVGDGAQRSTAGGDGSTDAVGDGAQRSTVVKTMVEKIV